MIIVSDTKLNNEYTKGNKVINYQEFLEMASSDEGLDAGMAFDINLLDEEVYTQLMDAEVFKFFSLDGEAPGFVITVDNIEDWSDAVETAKPKSNEKVFDIPPVEDGEIDQGIAALFNSDLDEDSVGSRNAEIILVGSSKGGSGKTFTAIITARRYARTHPDKKCALADFDIIDGQVGISIHAVRPTMAEYFKEYKKGYDDYQTMHNFSITSPDKFAPNLDFYLAPSNGRVIKDDDFWLNIITNLVENYDVVFFDTGIDYLNVRPISYAYKLADKINVVTTTSIKSVTSVTKMIKKLRGEVANEIFSAEDELGPKINIIITQMVDNDPMNITIYKTLSALANVVATFGVLSDSVSEAEYYSQWDVFDNNDAINKTLDNIAEFPEDA